MARVSPLNNADFVPPGVAPAPAPVRLDDILYGFGSSHENTPLVAAGRPSVVTPPTKPRRSHGPSQNGYLSQDVTPASDSSASTSESHSTEYRAKWSWGALPVGGTTVATTRYLADAQLETADARHPANVPMLVVRGYTPLPRRATQGHVTVERGAVVNALYKLADWLFVRTADDAVGFIPRACVEAIGPRTARDFGQQFPERTGDSVGTRRGRASFSPANTTTTTASSEGDGASGDDSGASLRDTFGFLHLRNGTPSPPPPPPPPPPTIHKMARRSD
ncbi:hypothetical protein LSAT2_019223 [Lamellibrachia satsuma]|nr:hypothetical protein LSAT2_019223 [Lamellibrachia satsuma]